MPPRLHSQTTVITPFEQNARILTDPISHQAIIIDPGSATFFHPGNYDYIVLTHAHLDHAGGVCEIQKKQAIPLAAHEHSSMVGQHIESLATHYGFPSGEFQNSPTPSHILTEGIPFKWGTLDAHVYFVPGHSPDHIVLFFDHVHLTLNGETDITTHDGPLLIAGDTLFHESIGRTDLPGGDHETLIHHIQTKLFTLPDATLVLPGHGRWTTIGHEKKHNPFVTI